MEKEKKRNKLVSLNFSPKIPKDEYIHFKMKKKEMHLDTCLTRKESSKLKVRVIISTKKRRQEEIVFFFLRLQKYEETMKREKVL